MTVHAHGHMEVVLSSKGLHDEWTFGFHQQSMEVYFWIAIGIMLLGNTFSAVGLLVQKRSHEGDSKTKCTCCGRSVPLYFTSPVWLLGFVIFVLAHVLCWISLALAPQSVLSGLMCWSTVVTFVLAPFFLGETVTVFKLLSACIMIFGCCWVVLSGPRVYQVFTVDVLRSQLHNVPFLALSGLALFYLVGCACWAGFQRLTAFQYATIAAILAWYSVLTAKISSSLVFSSWHHTDNQLDRWESWVALITMLVLAASNLHFLNMALSSGEAVYVVPVYESMSIFGQTLLGGIFFQEFQHLDTIQHINFWMGVSCIMIGVICLARKGPQTGFFQYPVISSRCSSARTLGSPACHL